MVISHMKVSTIKRSLETKFKEVAELYTAEELLVVFENTKPSLDNVPTWVRGTVLIGSVKSAGLIKESKDLYRGFLQIDCFTEKEIGAGKGTEILEHFASHMKKGFTIDNINIHNFEMLSSQEEDKYYRNSIQILFFTWL